jgi:hypothetical protein
MFIRKVKGRAVMQICRCGSPAAEWAFTGTGTHSRNPEDYVALCRPCHRQMDAPHHGEGHRSAKLTEESVRAIRRRAAGGESQRALAREFGVSQPAVMQAVNRRTWKHVTTD